MADFTLPTVISFLRIATISNFHGTRETIPEGRRGTIIGMKYSLAAQYEAHLSRSFGVPCSSENFTWLYSYLLQYLTPASMPISPDYMPPQMHGHSEIEKFMISML